MSLSLRTCCHNPSSTTYEQRIESSEELSRAIVFRSCKRSPTTWMRMRSMIEGKRRGIQRPYTIHMLRQQEESEGMFRGEGVPSLIQGVGISPGQSYDCNMGLEVQGTGADGSPTSMCSLLPLAHRSERGSTTRTHWVTQSRILT